MLSILTKYDADIDNELLNAHKDLFLAIWGLVTSQIGIWQLTYSWADGDIFIIVVDKRDYPPNTWRNDNVVITSIRRHFDVITSKWRRFGVIKASLLRNMSAGKSALVDDSNSSEHINTIQ